MTSDVYYIHIYITVMNMTHIRLERHRYIEMLS